MRLVHTVRIALGVVVLGGAAIGLSDTALAADGSLVSNAQTPNVKIELLTKQPQSSNVLPTESTAVTKLDSRVAEVNSTVSAAPVIIDSEEEVAKDDVLGDADSDFASVAESSQPDKDLPEAKLGVTMEAGESTEQISGQVLVTEPLAPVVPVETVVAQPVPVAIRPVVVRSTVVLPLQPTITNRTIQAQDLATTLPSAAPVAVDDAPIPAQSTGLLGRLTAGLAATVVPSLFMTVLIPTDRPALAMALGALLLTLVAGFVFNYGLWLRRGGFATAARSDEPTNSRFSIATPFVLSYASVPPHRHSSFFMVAEMKTIMVLSAFRKEDM